MKTKVLVGVLLFLIVINLSTIGVFVLFQLDFSLTALAAVLTIAGYSINDTVVIFDRVRENMRRYKKMPLIDLLNHSINETLSRTLLTSLTAILTVLALLFFTIRTCIAARRIAAPTAREIPAQLVPAE